MCRFFKNLGLALVLMVAGIGAAVPSHIVLFNNLDLSQMSKNIDKKERERQLIRFNKLNIEKLTDFLASKSLKVGTISNLWLIAGSALDLTPDIIKELRAETWVTDVAVNREHLMVQPLHVRGVEEREAPWGLSAIGLHELRLRFPDVTGAGVKVGVLDTGIQSHHPEFVNTAGVTFKDFVNGLNFPYDDHGHGTHVSGTIAGEGVGIAPSVALFVGKIFSASGSGYDHMIIEGMQWMYDPDGNPDTDDGPRVVNNSWGMSIDQGIYSVDEFLAFHRAIKTWLLGGMMPIFAAGNSGTHPNGIPGGFPEVLAIAAVGDKGGVAEFSSRGPNMWQMDGYVLSLFKPDFAAPGVDVLSAMPGNGYGLMSGTSMATPHMVGALALALQVKPEISFSSVKDLLLNTVTPKADMAYGHGSLSVLEMVSALKGGEQEPFESNQEAK